MEQEEKKQNSQAAENQASCSSLQPVEPHPFISVIPLAVLITLIVLDFFVLVIFKLQIGRAHV